MRITWTAEQKTVIAKQALAIFNTSSLSYNESLQQAMVVLPLGKRRDVKAMSGTQVRELRELGERLKAAEHQAPNVLQQAMPEAPSTAYMESMTKIMADMESRAALMEKNFTQRMEALVIMESRVTAAMDKLAMTSDKVSLMLKQIDDSNVELDLVRDELTIQMATVKQLIADAGESVKKPLTDDHVEGVTITPTIKKSDRRRVMVVGLLDQQAKLIEKEFGDRFKFTFIDTEGNQRGLAGRAANMDHIITTKFIDHAQYYQISNRKEHQHVHGGMSSLRDALMAL